MVKVNAATKKRLDVLTRGLNNAGDSRIHDHAHGTFMASPPRPDWRPRPPPHQDRRVCR